jgi:hypothetical protein
MTGADPLSLAGLVAGILEELGIRYVVGGSVASSILGEPRSTLDIDIMIEVDQESVQLLVKRLQDDFYADDEAAAEAVHYGFAFNAVHYATSTRIDFFPAENATFAREQLDRRRAIVVDPPGVTIFVYAAEDLIVRKLMWFRLGNEVSSRQWRDVLGLLKGAKGLDHDLLRRAADEVNVTDLLQRALADSGFS